VLTTEHGDDECWIWMESVRGRTGPSITLDDYALIARELGRMQGAYAANPPLLPTDEWLSRDWLRGWAETSAGQLAVVTDDIGWDDPRLASLVPLRRRAQDMWARRESLLGIVEAAPLTVVHLDFWPHNLFVDGSDVVAIDWSQVGIGALAQDLDQITLDPIWMQVLPEAPVHELEDCILPAYADGLRHSGCEVDDTELRRWYAAAAAVKYVPLLELQVAVARDPAKVAAQEQRFGRSYAEVTATKARVIMRAIELGEWALGSIR
jgi:hypothetical protein